MQGPELQTQDSRLSATGRIICCPDGTSQKFPSPATTTCKLKFHKVASVSMVWL